MSRKGLQLLIHTLQPLFELKNLIVRNLQGCDVKSDNELTRSFSEKRTKNFLKISS